MDPMTLAILTQIGMKLSEKVLGMFEEPSPAERALKQQVGIGGQLIPELQRQAGGGTTPAILASERRLQEESTRAGQTYAASARRRGVAGTIPATAQQGRIQGGMIRGLADIRGGAAQSAQQQLAGLYQGAPMQLAALEASRGEEQRGMYEDIGRVVGYWQSRGDREDDDKYTDMMERFMELLMSTYGNGGQLAPSGDFPTMAPGQ
jgi:hypothetical protein